MSRKVEIIQPTNPLQSIEDMPKNANIIKRTAAYCRVSTNSDEQANSFENQVEEWTKRILQNPQLQLVKIYSDEGVSGTSEKNRIAFNKMIKDAREGKIDLILCKSISRFARNTVLLIQTMRELKSLGVEIYFDTENLSSFDEKTELITSILASIAQEESKNISKNVRWTFQSMMKEGRPIITTSRFLGYTKGDDGNLKIVPEEAEIVKLIYTLYDQGCGIFEIRRNLRERGYKTITGNDYWHLSTIQSILRNEKYKGDLLLQKTFTIDYLTHKAVKNKGQVPSYYVTNSHEPIIDPEMWDRVQERIKTQSQRMVGANRDLSKYNTRYPLSGMLICNECGETYKRRQWISGYKVPKIMYQCNKYIEPKLQERCNAKPLSENLLLAACAKVINDLFLRKSDIFDRLENVIERAFSFTDTSKTIEDKNKEKDKLEKTINLLVSDRANCENEEMLNLLNNQYHEACEKYSALNQEIECMKNEENEEIEKKKRFDKIKGLISKRELSTEMITKEMLDVFLCRIIVVGKNDVVFTIDNSKSISLEELRNKRKEVAQFEPIKTGTISMRDPKKLATLTYKVVLI